MEIPKEFNFDEFIAWRNEKPNSRTFKVEVEPKGEFKVWAYDYVLGTGQHVTAASQIDLEGKAETNERTRLKELLKKYGGEVNGDS